ncbi:L,D-transpeptidase [Nocardioides sp. SYSU DS0651]|uniref:L,D-transpeptidase n=1 Tax=Nocardioides sp. SYSU DS0651 TaxID=3415955 RepID=UPI003F4C7C15
MKHAREPAGRHRAEVRPRYGRVSALGAALAVTLVAVAGGFGLLPSGGEPTAASSVTSADRSTAGSTTRPADTTDEPAADSASSAPAGRRSKAAAATGPEGAGDPDDTSLPPRSGSGRRVVFSESRQRVWLVDAAGKVLRSHLASGSVYDNLDPGSYEVFSRSRHAVGIDDSGTMEYFVRFTHGDAGAAIGFHTIPVHEGRPVQRVAQLGTPLSHGCIRQKRDDAIALWEFAPVGTTVVVTA